MPYTTVSINSPIDEGDAQALAADINRFLEEDLAKSRDLSVIRIGQPSMWFHGTEPAGTGTTAIEVHITAGTTSHSQRAAFIAHTHAALAERSLGTSPSYVIVHEHDGVTWGHGGVTQAARQTAP